MSVTTFISYSWDDENHTDWVLNLGNSLVKFGLDVILDQYDLIAGQEMTYFMEKAMLADKIVVILTPNYKLKADNRQGGVGYEYSMLTKKLLELAPDQTRIIPILRTGNKDESCPEFLGTKKFHDMSEDDRFDSKFFELTKLIQNKPVVKKPELGILKDDNKIDDIIPNLEETIAAFKTKESLYNRKKAKLSSGEGAELFTKTAEEVVAQILKYIGNYQTNFGIYFHYDTNNFNKILLSTVNYTFFFSTDYVYSNSAENAIINMNFFKGPVGLSYGIDYQGVTEVIYETKYRFDLDDNLNPIFIQEKNPNIILTPYDVSTIAVREVITNELKLRESRLK